MSVLLTSSSWLLEKSTSFSFTTHNTKLLKYTHMLHICNTYISHEIQPNEGIYSIHGAYAIFEMLPWFFLRETTSKAQVQPISVYHPFPVWRIHAPWIAYVWRQFQGVYMLPTSTWSPDIPSQPAVRITIYHHLLVWQRHSWNHPEVYHIYIYSNNPCMIGCPGILTKNHMQE